jgi:multiple sugar transport system permease protein
MHTQKRPLAISILIYGGLFLLGIFAFFPIYWMLITALTPNQLVFQFPPKFIPQQLTLEHFGNFFENQQLIRYTWNSLLVASVTAVSSVLISSYSAYSFSKFRYPGRGALMYLILSAQMFPQALLLISLYLMFNKLGLLNTYMSMILSFTTFTLPLCIWTLKGYFDKLPTELIEAAKIDGATQWTIFHSVLLPITRPALVATGLFAFIRGWNDYIFALTLAGPKKMTLPPGLALTYLGEFQAGWADMMASSLIVSLPVIVLFMFFQKQLVGGLASGAVKG